MVYFVMIAWTFLKEAVLEYHDVVIIRVQYAKK